MEPAFQRGDLLFLSRTQAPYRVGDITVYKLKGKDIPIVHRILEIHEPAPINSTTVDAPFPTWLFTAPPLPLYDPLSFVMGLPPKTQSPDTLMLTKGDNNRVDDRALYNRGQMWLKPDDVMGRVAGHLPYLGMLTILMNDYPQLKMALLASLALIALLTKEE